MPTEMPSTARHHKLSAPSTEVFPLSSPDYDDPSNLGDPSDFGDLSQIGDASGGRTGNWDARLGVGEPTPWSTMGGHQQAQWLLGGLVSGAGIVVAVGWALALGEVSAGATTIGALAATSVLWIRGAFRARVASEAASFLSKAMMAVAVGVAAGLFAALLPFVGHEGGSAPAALAWVAGVQLAAMVVANWVGVRLRRRLWLRGYMRAGVLVYGTDPFAREIAVELGLCPGFGLDVVGFVADENALALHQHGGSWRPPLQVPLFRPDESLGQIVHRSGVEYLVIGPGADDDGLATELCRWAASVGIVVLIVPRFYRLGLGLGDPAVDSARAYPLLRLQRSSSAQISLRLKRAADVAVSASLLLLAAPVMVAATLAVRVSSSGPVLFAQERVGQYGKPILIYKFRTMTTSEFGDVQWTADDRVTAVGALLRRLNIDELPQLYSVLVGDMSLVGPRPERPAFVQRFAKRYPDYHLRHRMPVGMTGLAQVEGLRGDTSIEERIKYDNLYIDQWSLALDLSLLARTLGAILRQRKQAQRVIDLNDALRLDRELSQYR